MFFGPRPGAVSDGGRSATVLVPVATIVCAQLPTEEWHDYIGDAALADAICDRPLHNAHQTRLRGKSRRDPHGQAADTEAGLDDPS
jgi:hypothetical protein